MPLNRNSGGVGELDGGKKMETGRKSEEMMTEIFSQLGLWIAFQRFSPSFSLWFLN